MYIIILGIPKTINRYILNLNTRSTILLIKECWYIENVEYSISISLENPS